MIKLKWAGPVYDSSGYGAATRPYICSLVNRNNVKITITTKSFEIEKTQHSLVEKFAHRINVQQDVEVQVSHFTPENFSEVMSPLPGVYNIGYTAWETDRIPTPWIQLCNRMDEIWVPSVWNKEVFSRSGVIRPITVIPHIIENIDSEKKLINLNIPENTFLFYSIFQWHERKNPLSLLRAYLTEFSAEENVCLVLKSYRLNTSEAERKIIHDDVRVTKQGLQLGSFPKVRFIPGLLDSSEMEGLHSMGNCFVLPSRGEGFGIPYAEAMLRGKPTIGTRYSGNLDFMNDDNSYLIDSRITPVCNMIFGNYTGHMNWGDPGITSLRKLMREVYTDPVKANTKAEIGRQDILNNYSSKVIGDLIVSRLKEIVKHE